MGIFKGPSISDVFLIPKWLLISLQTLEGALHVCIFATYERRIFMKLIKCDLLFIRIPFQGRKLEIYMHDLEFFFLKMTTNSA